MSELNNNNNNNKKKKTKKKKKKEIWIEISAENQDFKYISID